MEIIILHSTIVHIRKVEVRYCAVLLQLCRVDAAATVLCYDSATLQRYSLRSSRHAFTGTFCTIMQSPQSSP